MKWEERRIGHDYSFETVLYLEVARETLLIFTYVLIYFFKTDQFGAFVCTTYQILEPIVFSLTFDKIIFLY